MPSHGKRTLIAGFIHWIPRRRSWRCRVYSHKPPVTCSTWLQIFPKMKFLNVSKFESKDNVKVVPKFAKSNIFRQKFSGFGMTWIWGVPKIENTLRLWDAITNNETIVQLFVGVFQSRRTSSKIIKNYQNLTFARRNPWSSSTHHFPWQKPWFWGTNHAVLHPNPPSGARSPDDGDCCLRARVLHIFQKNPPMLAEFGLICTQSARTEGAKAW